MHLYLKPYKLINYIHLKFKSFRSVNPKQAFIAAVPKRRTWDGWH